MTDRVELERNYWDEAALDPEVDIKYISDISTEECLDALGDEVVEPGMILDIGCGVGRISNEVGAVGIDISENMLEIARKGERFDDQYWMCDGRNIPFPDDTFDSAYSMLLFQHLQADAFRQYIGEIFRVLKIGSIFRFQFIEGISNEPFSNHYPLKLVELWLEEAGFGLPESIDRGLGHPQWTWISVVK